MLERISKFPLYYAPPTDRQNGGVKRSRTPHSAGKSRGDTVRIGSQATVNGQFIQAITRGDIDSARRLLSKGANVDVVHKGRPLLCTAIVEGYLEEAVFLLNNKANPHLTGRSNNTALHYAGSRDYSKQEEAIGLSVVRLLLARGAGVNALANGRVTPLHRAVQHYSVTIVEILLQHGALVNARTISGRTPLHYLAQKFADEENVRNCSVPVPDEILKLLLKYGASVNARDDKNRTALYIINHCKGVLVEKEDWVYEGYEYGVRYFPRHVTPFGEMVADMQNTLKKAGAREYSGAG